MYFFHISDTFWDTLIRNMNQQVHIPSRLGLLGLFLQIQITWSYKNGAPLTQCISMQPGHGYSMNSPGSFTLQPTTTNTYTPGGNAVQGRLQPKFTAAQMNKNHKTLQNNDINLDWWHFINLWYSYLWQQIFGLPKIMKNSPKCYTGVIFPWFFNNKPAFHNLSILQMYMFSPTPSNNCMAIMVGRFIT